MHVLQRAAEPRGDHATPASAPSCVCLRDRAPPQHAAHLPSRRSPSGDTYSIARAALHCRSLLADSFAPLVRSNVSDATQQNDARSYKGAAAGVGPSNGRRSTPARSGGGGGATSGLQPSRLAIGQACCDLHFSSRSRASPGTSSLEPRAAPPQAWPPAQPAPPSAEWGQPRGPCWQPGFPWAPCSAPQVRFWDCSALRSSLPSSQQGHQALSRLSNHPSSASSPAHPAAAAAAPLPPVLPALLLPAAADISRPGGAGHALLFSDHGVVIEGFKDLGELEIKLLFC